MLRTQIYLPEEFRSRLDQAAEELNVSMAEVVRMILKDGLEKRKKSAHQGNDLFRLEEVKIRGGPKDLSQNLDQYLYR